MLGVLPKKCQCFTSKVAEISQISREIRFECEIESREILTARFARFSERKSYQNIHLFWENSYFLNVK